MANLQRFADPLPPVAVALPDGSVISSEDARFAEIVSAALGRRVMLAPALCRTPSWIRTPGRRAEIHR
jgi:hypothetical protein